MEIEATKKHDRELLQKERLESREAARRRLPGTSEVLIEEWLNLYGLWGTDIVVKDVA